VPHERAETLLAPAQLGDGGFQLFGTPRDLPFEALVELPDPLFRLLSFGNVAQRQ